MGYTTCIVDVQGSFNANTHFINTFNHVEEILMLTHMYTSTCSQAHAHKHAHTAHKRLHTWMHAFRRGRGKGEGRGLTMQLQDLFDVNCLEAVLQYIPVMQIHKQVDQQGYPPEWGIRRRHSWDDQELSTDTVNKSLTKQMLLNKHEINLLQNIWDYNKNSNFQETTYTLR